MAEPEFEILVDLDDVFEEVNDWLGDVDVIVARIPALQVLATVALCERVDRLNRHLGYIGDTITDFIAWYQAVSPRR